MLVSVEKTWFLVNMKVILHLLWLDVEMTRFCQYENDFQAKSLAFGSVLCHYLKDWGYTVAAKTNMYAYITFITVIIINIL